MMGCVIVGIIIICIVFLGLCLLHRSNKEKVAEINRVMLFSEMDEIIQSQIATYANAEKKYDFMYGLKDLPYGRIMAFLNFFGRSIYDEEPFMFLCKRSSRDDVFQEYGVVFARTGIYIMKEISSGDKKQLPESKMTHINLVGLMQIFAVGSHVLTINYREGHLVDKIRFYDVESSELARAVNNVGKAIVGNDIGIFQYKNNVAEVLENTDVEPISEDMISASEMLESEESFDFDKAEKKLGTDLAAKGIKAAGVQAVAPKFTAFFGEVKNLMNGSRGHGYAAEYGNNTADRVLGRNVESAAQQLDSHGRQVKHGADRLVNNTQIQTKYYKTASESIGAAFEKKQAIYINESTGKMMQIEVPRDQYQDALTVMQKRIDSGQVPNVAPGESAKDYVRRGFFTYEQSFNIARAGTIESLTVDIAAGAVCCLSAAGITSAIIFAQAMWNGKTPKEALTQSLQSSLVVMGKGTFIYTLTMQLSRKEFANILAGKVFTVDGISQGYKAFSNPIYNLSENMATSISKSGVASTGVGQALGLNQLTGRQLIGGTVTVAVVFGPDVVRALQGKISTMQLLKNSAVGAAGMAGAAAGQTLIPIPVVGAMVGGTVAGVGAKVIADHFIEDDSKEMFRILKEEFIDQTMLVGLTQEEFEEVTTLTVGNKKISKLLQNMYQSKDYRNYARDSIMMPAIIKVLEKRNKITQKDYDQALIEMIPVLE